MAELEPVSVSDDDDGGIETPDDLALALEEDLPPPKRRVRLIVLAVLAVLIVGASVWLFGTPQGRALLDREQLIRFGLAARSWMEDNPVSFITIFIAAYIVCAILLLPVWWLQVLSGFAFGLFAGVGWVMVGSTCGAIATALVSAWLGEEYVHARIIGNSKSAQRLRRAVAVLGQNGLLVVFICRLSYPVPYGVSNYLFGLTGIKLRDIALGTALGGTPIYAGWVAAGARPDWLSRWEFWAVVIGVNAALLVPLVLRTVFVRRRAARDAAATGFSMAPKTVAVPAGDGSPRTLQH